MIGVVWMNFSLITSSREKTEIDFLQFLVVIILEKFYKLSYTEINFNLLRSQFYFIFLEGFFYEEARPNMFSMMHYCF